MTPRATTSPGLRLSVSTVVKSARPSPCQTLPEASVTEAPRAEHGAEGYVSGNVFATHITGPVLVKNPAFLDFLTRRLFECRGWDLPEKLPPLPHQREAYALIYARTRETPSGRRPAANLQKR